ncbi:MAG: hypothetical protein JWR26_1410 [Pedosphaera sp.]|nr:hypothetical protein [Pedosphaera sp.]
MITDKTKMSIDKSQPTPGSAGTASMGAATAKTPMPPLFRKIDWLAFFLTALIAFTGYFLTMAPEVTLQDSGELATGSFYAGVPHPPGYPLWTVFTWIFTKIVPFGNVAYRVALASAFSGAAATGLIGLLVSRGSSMILEGITEFKGLSRSVENAICVVSGVVAGLLMAYNGYMWSQSVIVEVYPFSVLSLMGVMCCVLRWMYAPYQRRYIYMAWFLFGICFTNHQTLIVAAIGLEAAILAAQPRVGRDLLLGNSIVYILGLIVLASGLFGDWKPSQMVFIMFHIVGVSSIIGCGWLTMNTQKLGTEMVPVLIMFTLWVVGFSFYFYMPLTSMSNPPMNWGYPRTVEGFIHALTRGQYEKANPVNIFTDPGRFIGQLFMYAEWAIDEFNLVNLVLAIVPIVFFLRMQKRERSWLIGLASIWGCLAIILMILLNPAADRASRDLNKVFFSASFTVIAMFAGYGLTLISAFMVTQYGRFRNWGILGGAVAILLALITLGAATGTFFSSIPNLGGLDWFFHSIPKFFQSDQYSTFYKKILASFEPDHFGLPVKAALLLLAMAVAFLLLNLASKARPKIALALAIFALLPAHSIMSHWSDNEERGHWFGYWFGHDMFTPPFKVYPEMTRDAVLFGGTDPGRFCPTYMVFCESFTPHDQQPVEDQKFDRRDVYVITQNALADLTYLEYIRAHYNRSTQIDPPFFQELLRSKKEVEQNYVTNSAAKLAGQIMDRPFLKLGADIEARRRKEGVYPPKEIYTPSPEDSARCFNEYMADAQRRVEHDSQYPQEQRQIRPGEDIHISQDGRVSVSGQVAVMSINGLLTKVIFDHNPTNEFFVEESFPLDWMYPHLSPFGVIMKINRQPLEEVTDEMVKKDHDFWSRYSDRLIGNWVTYETSVKEIADFVDKVYRERDFAGFKGDRRFVRDDDAQKAFSKLRSSIGGIYAWRLGFQSGMPTPQQYLPKSNAERDRMLKEADFAYRQAFAFCPYSPEAVFRYVTLLIGTGRIDDALIVANTCVKLDPNNLQAENLVKQLQEMKTRGMGSVPGQQANVALPQPTIQQLEAESRANPTNFQAAFNLAATYMQMHDANKAIQMLDQIVTNPQADVGVITAVAQAYAQMSNFAKLEVALKRWTELDPHSPEAWYNLAALETALGKQPDALKDLRVAFDESSVRLIKEPKAANLQVAARTDQRFTPLQQSAEFKQLTAPK